MQKRLAYATNLVKASAERSGTPCLTMIHADDKHSHKYTNFSHKYY